MKKNNKGFTLVELIVVLVILAILAAILVPALLGYIDKAREKSVTTNAEAAYVAAQALASEYYGTEKAAADATATKCKDYVTWSKIEKLTDINDTVVESKIGITSTKGASGHDACIITKFHYENADYKADWDNGTWTVNKKTASTTPADSDNP